MIRWYEIMVKNVGIGVREKAQQFKALGALSEDQALVPNNHMITCNSL